MEQNEKYKTKGKNAPMLKAFKQKLNETLQEYNKLKEKDLVNRIRLEKIIGECFLKLAEFAVIRYNWNKWSGRYSIDIDGIYGEIVLGLWAIISKRKFNLKRLNNENSVYNFFMMSANNMAKYEMRKHLTKEDKVHFNSLEKMIEKQGGDAYDNLICEDFFRSDKIYVTGDKNASRNKRN